MNKVDINRLLLLTLRYIEEFYCNIKAVISNLNFYQPKINQIDQSLKLENEYDTPNIIYLIIEKLHMKSNDYSFIKFKLFIHKHL